MMQCPNCRQPIEDEQATECWHCGISLQDGLVTPEALATEKVQRDLRALFTVLFLAVVANFFFSPRDYEFGSSPYVLRTVLSVLVILILGIVFYRHIRARPAALGQSVLQYVFHASLWEKLLLFLIGLLALLGILILLFYLFPGQMADSVLGRGTSSIPTAALQGAWAFGVFCA